MGQFVRALGLALLLLWAGLMPPAGWMVRNGLTFSVWRLSNADAVMLVYFAGAGAYQVKHGLSLEEAQERISREYHLAPPIVTNNHWITDRPIGEIDAELRQAVWPVLSRYPAELVVSSFQSIVKASVSHNTPLLAFLLGTKWVAPNYQAVLRGEREAWERLIQNPLVLILAFGWQLLHVLATWLLALPGALCGLWRPETRWFSLCLIAVLLYFQLTVALVGCEAYARSRAPHLPFVLVFVGVAVERLTRQGIWQQLPGRIAPA